MSDNEDEVFVKTVVHEFLTQFVIINETHLNIRDKCPDEFIFIGRSKPIESLTPRGCVAVFQRIG